MLIIQVARGSLSEKIYLNRDLDDASEPEKHLGEDCLYEKKKVSLR